MPALRTLLSDHSTVLLVDSTSTFIQIGLLRAHHEPLWETSTDEAGSAVFTGTEKLLARAGLALADVGAFLFCDGPGSVLGIRIAAVALRTWRVLHPRPIYSYCSLAIVAHALVRSENARALSVIADARRDSWHHLAIDAAGAVSPLRRVSAAQLSGAAVMPENFRHWTALPPALRFVPYTLACLLPLIDDVPLFDPAPEPDAFLHEEPSYQTWTPQIHRPPV